jgi:hypothetical protein
VTPRPGTRRGGSEEWATPWGHRLRARWQGLARALVLVVPVATLLGILLEWNGIPGQDRDTVAYHRAAVAARSNSPLYEPLPPAGPHEFRGVHYYLYPPPLAALLSVLPTVSYRTFDRGWLIANWLAFWVLAAARAKLATGAWGVAATARWGTAVFLLLGPWLAIRFGNIDLMILALAALGLALPAGGGALFGWAAAFKVAPGWALLTLLSRRPRQVLWSTGLALTTCAGACVAVFGATRTIALTNQWLTEIMPTLAQGQFWGGSLAQLRSGNLGFQDVVSNLSLSFLPVQLWAGWGGSAYDGGPLPGPVRLYLTAVAFAAPLIMAWVTRRRSPELQVAVVLAAALLAAPIVRPYVLAVLLLVEAARRQEGRGRGRLGRTVVSEPSVVATPVRSPG